MSVILTVNSVDVVQFVCNNAYMPIDERALYLEIGSRLKQRRSEIGRTQDELADAVGLLRTSIANIESGRQRTPVHVLYNLCLALSTDLEAILPSAKEITVQQRVQMNIEGSIKEVTPKTAELLHRLLGTDENADGSIRHGGVNDKQS